MTKLAALSLQELNARRRRAVELRLDGSTLNDICTETSLSAPTVIGAYKSFLRLGWQGVATRSRGRTPGTGRSLSAGQENALLHILLNSPPEAAGAEAALAPGLWTPDSVRQAALSLYGQTLRGRALSRFLHRAGLALDTLSAVLGREPALAEWQANALPTIVRRARQQGASLVWCGQFKPRPASATQATAQRLLVAQTLRGSLAWLPLRDAYRIEAYTDFLSRLALTWPGDTMVLLHGIDFSRQPALAEWLAAHPGWALQHCPAAQSASTAAEPAPMSVATSAPVAAPAAARPETSARPFNPSSETHSS